MLASPPARYAQYAADVRREYSHLGDEEWRVGRGDLVRHLLEREQLFHTELGRTRWEPLARVNLAAELAALTGAEELARAE